MYPAKFPGLGEALIFFCFFSSIKGRKEDHSRIQKRVGRQVVGAYCIQLGAKIEMIFLRGFAPPPHLLFLS